MTSRVAKTLLAQSPFRTIFENSAGRNPSGRADFCDLSALPRIGYKGRGTTNWLAAQGVVIPAEPNRAAQQPDGSLVARLSAEEYLILSDPKGATLLIETLEASRNPAQVAIGYPLPRADSHFWLYLAGEHYSDVMAKFCAVDLRSSVFLAGMLAQTVAARISVIVLRDHVKQRSGLHILGDFASAAYIFDVLCDACDEFDGGPVRTPLWSPPEGKNFK